MTGVSCQSSGTKRRRVRVCVGGGRKRKKKPRKGKKWCCWDLPSAVFHRTPLERHIFSPLCGDFVSVDVLASVAGVILGAHAEVGTHPSFPGMFRGTLGSVQTSPSLVLRPPSPSALKEPHCLLHRKHLLCRNTLQYASNLWLQLPLPPLGRR